MPDRIKAVIFDMGGVLLRTIDPVPRELMAQRFGTTRKELEQFVFLSPTSLRSEIGEISEIQHWQAVLKHFGQENLDALSAYEEFFSGDAIDKELLSYATSLKVDFQLGLLSNAWMHARQHINKNYTFMDIFDIAIFSAEIGLRKPDPRIFHLILDRLGVSANEAVFIDDFQENVESAINLGFAGIQFFDTNEVIEQLRTLLKIK